LLKTATAFSVMSFSTLVAMVSDILNEAARVKKRRKMEVILAIGV
jgi:hypothetical protein